MEPQLDLFSMITEEAQYKPVEDFQPAENTKDMYEAMCIERDIQLHPDDLTIIRLLLANEYMCDKESAMERAEQYVQQQMEGKFSIYDDAPADIDKFQEYAMQTVRNAFLPIYETFADIQKTLEERKYYLFMHPEENNAEYAAYLYNLNATFHGKNPIPYQELEKIFRETVYNY